MLPRWRRPWARCCHTSHGNSSIPSNQRGSEKRTASNLVPFVVVRYGRQRSLALAPQVGDPRNDSGTRIWN